MLSSSLRKTFPRKSQTPRAELQSPDGLLLELRKDMASRGAWAAPSSLDAGHGRPTFCGWPVGPMLSQSTLGWVSHFPYSSPPPHQLAGNSCGQLSPVGQREQGWGSCQPGKSWVGVDSGGRGDGHVGSSSVPAPADPFYSHKVKRNESQLCN